MRVTPAGVVFGALEAPETVIDRANVIGWAEDLYLEQRETWRTHKRLEMRNKPRAPTWRECIDKSREVAARRERDHSYFNQIASPDPLY